MRSEATQKLQDCAQALYQQNMQTSDGGNISLRHDTNSMLIKASKLIPSRAASAKILFCPTLTERPSPANAARPRKARFMGQFIAISPALVQSFIATAPMPRHAPPPTPPCPTQPIMRI